MDEEMLLYEISKRRWGKAVGEQLGDIAGKYLDRRGRGLEASAAVLDVWGEVLPGDFYEHCEVVSLVGGRLVVEVDPGPYMHELRIMSSELLEHLQGRCGRAKIKNIKLRARKRRSK